MEIGLTYKKARNYGYILNISKKIQNIVPNTLLNIIQKFQVILIKLNLQLRLYGTK